MPPKKKTKKDEDFKKAKLKVGKKKAPPSNKTDTSFKSKSILLPKQDLEEKNISGTELVSSRNQTLPELISLLRHHSAPIRKDAASGIEEIFQKDQDYVLQRLNVVVDATCHLFADEDRGVRSSGRSLASVLLSNASASKVRPFMPLIMAYTAAALTHITEDVRLDALKLMQIYATSIPTLIAPYANQILTNYVSILSSNSVSAAKGPSSGNKGPSLSVNPNSKLGLGLSRIEVLTSLLGFLEKILNKGMTTYWYFYERNETIETLLGNQLAIQRLWTDPLYNVLLNRPNEFIATVLHENDMESIYGFDANPATKLDVETPTSKKPGQERLNIKHISLDTSRSTDKMETAQTLDFNRSSAASSQTMREVADKLIPILIDFWIEAVAYISGVDSGASKSETFLTALEVCHLTLQLMLTVFRAMVASGQLREWAKADRAWGENLLNLLLKHVIVHFPLGGDSFYSHDSKVNYTYQRMNVTCCELLSYFMHSLRETGKGSDNLRLSKSMLRYLLTIFDKNAREQEVGKKRLNSIELKPEHLAATFPTVWILLNQLTAPDQLQLFDAIIRYHFQSGSTSATKKVLFHYVARIFMLRSSRQWRGGFVPSLNGSHPTDEHGEKFVKLHREFLASLPKWLWELRTSDIELGGAILRYQTQNLRENVFEVANDRIHMEHLQNALTPLFHVSIPNRGDIYGPFRDLPVGEQRGTLDLLFYFTSPWSTKLLSALVACFCRQHSHGISADVHLHLLTIVSERQNSLATALEVPLFVGFIMTLGIVGYTKDDLIVLRSAVGYGGAKAVSFQELHSIWEKSKSTVSFPPKFLYF
ncbi:hypothetical protein BJ742DRAFT_201776 [Cladochytrium replicatum]|nr:hypothetical protein BJ742DRAFT_201776 [Cladochytrium replicatum]